MVTYGVILKFIQGLTQLIFPDNCLTCRAYLNSNHARQLCPKCLDSIVRNTPPFCSICSRHLDHFNLDSICTPCQSQHYHFDRAYSACFFDETMRRLIHEFKYNGKTQLHKTFIPLICDFIDLYRVPIGTFDLIAPIPLHPARQRERGFNQSEILSEALAAHYKLPHQPHLLQRIRPTETQTILDQKQRWTNLQGAFKMNPSVSIKDRSILLVDDLLTTKATANAAASCLKGSGAAHVSVITLSLTR